MLTLLLIRLVQLVAVYNICYESFLHVRRAECFPPKNLQSATGLRSLMVLRGDVRWAKSNNSCCKHQVLVTLARSSQVPTSPRDEDLSVTVFGD